MATLYVDARNGNDSANGTTWAAAWKTLGAAGTGATTGDTIYCVGVFNEKLTLPAKTLTFRAQGYAVIDATNTLTHALYSTGSSSAKTHTFYDFRFTSATTAAAGMGDLNSVVFYRCVFENSPKGCVNSYTHNITMYNCVIRNCATVGVDVDNGIVGSAFLHNCTLTENGIGLRGGTTDSVFAASCVFHANTTHISVPSSGVLFATSEDKNCIDFGSGNCICGTTKTSLADWKTATGQDANSITGDPLFLDSAKQLYRLSTITPAVIDGNILGAYSAKLGYGITHELNNALWEGATVAPASGAVLNGNNDWVLASGTSATVTFETADFGTAKNVRRINLSGAYAGLGAGVGGGPSSVFDYDKADTLPETWQYRVAVSSDGSTYGAFASKNLYDDLNLTNVRRLKVEVTLRNDA